ncbi:RepB family plasmid replication initiator protein [Avibacterium paragallinarum]|uniref:RepB family plasmid replication initiator protein n=3 Tax=Avibacterium paragallinarum TaxID=728 RepID=A0A380X6A8_AVIPA|nr:replication initiation protein [Avibacterium paragallinarum]AZI13537.1 RepB family plasmid replication initiator protein [Avibacterium paragallinarum]QIR10859.1 replication initiation protein [Avibacterium paragallinarum]QJE10289.1 replication initiation protein [Avibacterium paragallinarum]QJE12483.1 replication initiation protein [Avibacterium paragallinarum]QJE14686.1 replication initiation protein [Avibacterium paragallinarum]
MSAIYQIINQFPDVNADRAYTQIKSAIERISERWVKTEDERHVTKFRWVSSQTYFKKEGRFKIALTNEIMPYLTQLKGQFTQYQLNHISGFSSVHAIRLYELFTQYKRLGDRYISVEDLKKWLQLEDKYERYNNLNQWVLLPALSEINEKSDLFAKYEPIKKGRKIVGIEFSITYEKTVKKRPKFPHKNKYGKFVKLDRIDPKMSSAKYGNYARDCLKILEDFYSNIEDVPNEDLLYYWIFFAVNQSHKSKLGSKNTFADELRQRGYKIAGCELVKLEK